MEQWGLRFSAPSYDDDCVTRERWSGSEQVLARGGRVANLDCETVVGDESGSGDRFAQSTTMWLAKIG
jgi:hypothetical protein